MLTRYGLLIKTVFLNVDKVYNFQISLFDAENRRSNESRIGHEFEGLVTSTLKPLESQCNKDDIFVTTFHQARNYTDQWGNLNFIIRMKRMSDGRTEDVQMATS